MARQQVSTSIRTAFNNIKVKPSAHTGEGARIGAIIWDALAGKAGIVHREDWSTKLSLRTYQDLKAQDIMA